ncbi:MAG: family transposase [Microvirga sp.]|nr:family transposase [Microvirga sp.]
MLNVIDEFTRECLAIRIDRKLNSTSVIDVLSDLFVLRGVPGHVRSDNGPEFVAKAVRDWIAAIGARTALGEWLLRELQLQAAWPRRASSSKAGACITTPSDLTPRSAINHRLQRPSCP